MELIYVLIFILLFFPALLYWIFEEAGQEGWKSFIPVYNYFVWMKIIAKPKWWLIFMLIPFICFFMIMLLLVETAIAYGKFKLGEQALAVIIPVIYLPYLGISSKEKYIPTANRVRIKKSAVREWVDAIIFAVVAASIIRMFLFEAYTIPTSSMEKSMLVGDFLFVDKISYGSRIPQTPLAFPFVHHTLPLTQYTKSFVEWIKLPYYRFPGFTKVKRGNVVVFNYPDGDTVALKMQNTSYYGLIRQYGRQVVWSNPYEFGDIIARPVDKRENYIKRCIALPGDTLEIKDAKVYVNNQLQPFPVLSEFKYFIKTDGTGFNPRFLEKLDITEQISQSQDGDYEMTLTQQSLGKIRELSNVKSVTLNIQPKNLWEPWIFPFDSTYAWNVDNFGPLYIPKAGATVELTTKNLPLYTRIISAYEHNTLKVENGKIYINGKEAKSYTFKLDYYWMQGDNRHNSADSRYWGFVPIDHIVGKAVFVWLSLDQNKSVFNGKIRFNKMFRVVR